MNFLPFVYCIWLTAALSLLSVTAEDQENTVAEQDSSTNVPKPEIKYLHYDSEVGNRYATTVVSSKVANPANVSQEVHFSLVLPESAFISGFVIIVKDEEYKSYVREKEKAKQEYDAAVAAGQTAAHVLQSVRDSNRFQVSVNVEAEGKIIFKLTYEELLVRTLGVYTHTINVNPRQIVKDLSVKVNISELVDITSIKVLDFKTKNEIASDDKKDNTLAKVVHSSTNPKVANITWSPSVDDQMKIEKDGIKGQLVIQYDVDRSNASQILLDEGYFVHFFTPDSTTSPPLSKHVVFVLDISGSMYGKKIEQLRAAMVKILDDLNKNDYFSIVLFSSDTLVWSPEKTQHLFSNNTYAAYNIGDSEIAAIVTKRGNNEILLANETNIALGKEFVEKIFPTDATNIIGGLREGINITAAGQKKFLKESNDVNSPQPMIVFLTDGQPNVEISDPEQIVNVTTLLNKEKTPIYSLAFGDGADLQFLRRLSLSNNGFARNIYEASDAALQLNNFYKEISSPLMSGVEFDYLPGQVENGSLTKQYFPVLFRGSEVIVAGKFIEANVSKPEEQTLQYKINTLKSFSKDKNYNFNGGSCAIFPLFPMPELQPENGTFGHLEKLWAYLNIKQLLDKDTSVGTSDDKKSPEKEEALRLALKYSFVTPLTSLVVIKPNETESTVQPEKASESGGSINSVPLSLFGSGGLHAARPMSPSFIAASGGFYATTPFSGAPASSIASAGFPGSMPSYENSVDNTDSCSPPNCSANNSTFMNATLPNIVTLDSIEWLANKTEDFEIEVPFQGNFTVAFNQTDITDGNCFVANGMQHTSYCRHLEYCPLDVFAKEMDEYINTYFCSIHDKYAGVCCPTAPAS